MRSAITVQGYSPDCDSRQEEEMEGDLGQGKQPRKGMGVGVSKWFSKNKGAKIWTETYYSNEGPTH